ncbi:ral guanine nucleotide dissociation stimulator-like [Mustela putorius furo]|uniref:Ral guanine nucleotide dissociation stimulator-like n=1 Tax=Mustela putorius furo TaxID=9669 RepID=A0A8U0RLZ3_MUSPF|nr:ral guanine nucleotide dissociation stimulator-like [Mustela putorius furo]XP_044925622.1 ral guanine nucleotide dissociation stimulator-like [Mustela putorius furo]XP_044925624.1 ral guanine nucleotide dissociation stimulator-like [Mustela putorius furo]XP_044925625.1 ral guanine nucleotide dissociation stimulator-like [Mustela putorius furo]XP_044925626.1 ral guanine nucleotide dissociation stimulator-like [Mustela putorius furo]XP_044925627.1 ral guanine nucleotide dissociation stimulato
MLESSIFCREGTIPVRHNGLSKVQTRSWLKPPPRCLRIFRGRRHKNAPEDMVQELNVDIPCSHSLKDKKPHRANRVWRWLRGENGSTRKRNKTSIVWNTRASSLEAGIDYLVTAVIKQDLNYVNTFLEIYRTLATTQEVLDLLFARFGCVYSTYDEVGGPQDQRNMAIYAILYMWVERYPGDFVQPPEFSNLHALLAYLQVNLPGSDLQRRAQLLLPERQRAETTEPEAGAPAPEPDQDVSQKVVPAATLAPAAPLRPELVPSIPAMAAHYGIGRPVTPPDPLGPGQMVVRALVHFSATEEPPGLLTFLDDQQGPAHELPPPASVEQAGSAPEQHLVLATTRNHVFPIALVALFVFLLFCVYVYNYILDLIK